MLSVQQILSRPLAMNVAHSSKFARASATVARLTRTVPSSWPLTQQHHQTHQTISTCIRFSSSSVGRWAPPASTIKRPSIPSSSMQPPPTPPMPPPSHPPSPNSSSEHEIAALRAELDFARSEIERMTRIIQANSFFPRWMRRLLILGMLFIAVKIYRELFPRPQFNWLNALELHCLESIQTENERMNKGNLVVITPESIADILKPSLVESLAHQLAPTVNFNIVRLDEIGTILEFAPLLVLFDFVSRISLFAESWLPAGSGKKTIMPRVEVSSTRSLQERLSDAIKAGHTFSLAARTLAAHAVLATSPGKKAQLKSIAAKRALESLSAYRSALNHLEQLGVGTAESKREEHYHVIFGIIQIQQYLGQHEEATRLLNDLSKSLHFDPPTSTPTIDQPSSPTAILTHAKDIMISQLNETEPITYLPTPPADSKDAARMKFSLGQLYALSYQLEGDYNRSIECWERVLDDVEKSNYSTIGLPPGILNPVACCNQLQHVYLVENQLKESHATYLRGLTLEKSLVASMDGVITAVNNQSLTRQQKVDVITFTNEKKKLLPFLRKEADRLNQLAEEKRAD